MSDYDEQRAEHRAEVLKQGSSHYKGTTIQPVEYIQANKLDFIEGNIIKYVTRWKKKGGVEDLNKAKHYIELLIELEGG